MRKRSGGTVEQLPSGRYRARRKTDGKYRSIGTFATEEEARLALQQPAKAPQGALLLATFGEEWLKRRRGEISDYRNDEQRWRLYIEQRIGQLPLRKIRRADVKDWLRELRQLGLATQTRKNARTVLSQCLEDAVDRELIETNPVRGIRFKRREEARTHEPWTILYPDEQLALLEAVPSDEWHTVAFALGAGVRNSEQWHLQVSDVSLDERVAIVRRSTKGGPTKSGKIRSVSLFGVALEAARVALERQKYACPYVFPSPRTNDRRYDTSHPSRWHKWVKAAGITRNVRWYDLRHTCATSLLAGWWGRKWNLDEVRQLLGHSSVKVTERYAHLLDETLRRAGASTPGLVGFHAEGGQRVIQGANSGIRTRDLRFTKPQFLEGFSGLAVENFHARSSARDSVQAARLLEATRLAFRMGRDALARARVRELLELETREVWGG
jgi:integrase